MVVYEKRRETCKRRAKDNTIENNENGRVVSKRPKRDKKGSETPQYSSAHPNQKKIREQEEKKEPFTISENKN